jgi:hypothetical protein
LARCTPGGVITIRYSVPGGSKLLLVSWPALNIRPSVNSGRKVLTERAGWLKAGPTTRLLRVSGPCQSLRLIGRRSAPTVGILLLWRLRVVGIISLLLRDAIRLANPRCELGVGGRCETVDVWISRQWIGCVLDEGVVGEFWWRRVVGSVATVHR